MIVACSFYSSSSKSKPIKQVIRCGYRSYVTIPSQSNCSIFVRGATLLQHCKKDRAKNSSIRFGLNLPNQHHVPTGSNTVSLLWTSGYSRCSRRDLPPASSALLQARHKADPRVSNINGFFDRGRGVL